MFADKIALNVETWKKLMLDEKFNCIYELSKHCKSWGKIFFNHNKFFKGRNILWKLSLPS